MAKPAVTIYHNPKCGTSRSVLEALRAKGIEPAIVLYLENPPSKTKLAQLLKKMRAKPRDLLRRRGTPYDELGLDDPKLSDDAILNAIATHPLLIERPIVETTDAALLCRPADRLSELL